MRMGMCGIAAAMLISGCAVGPDFHRPAAPKTKGYTAKPLPEKTASADTPHGEAQAFAPGKDIPAQWWTLFHSQDLNALITKAIAANPDLQAAHASLKEAQENVYAAEGVFLPSIDAKGTASHQKISYAQFGRPGTGGTQYTLYNASVNVSYGIDVFGYDRRQYESYTSQLAYQRFQMEAAYLTLTSNVVTTAVQEASLAAQIAATREIIASESQQLDILRQQYAVGAAAQADVLAQRTTLAQSKATLPPLQKQLAATRNLLATLAGNLPSQGPGASFDLATLQLPAELPVSLPSKLVEQRPDIRAAEAQLHEASAKVGVATAAMLPQFTLTGGYGRVGTHTNDLLFPSNEIWNFGAGLLQPIFHGGELLHQRRAAVAAFKKAAAQYRATVLTAFRNVADTLRALAADADTLAAEAEAENAAADSLSLAKNQFKVGAISYLALLNAERAYEQTHIALVQAQAMRYADTAALFQALGGGWWNRHDVAALDAATQTAKK
jgi:NodT family efflux transporter outer membrane factor (OMF) lipoprotein